MTSKERVLAAVSHQVPDRVPIGELGIDHDHVAHIIGRPTYWRNRKETTLALWDNRRDEVVKSCIHDYEELVNKLDYDVITLDLVPSKNHKVTDKPKQIADGVWQDSKGITYKYAASNDSIYQMDHSEGKLTLSDKELNEIYKRATVIDDSCFEVIEYFGKKYGKEKAIIARTMDVAGFLEGPFGGDYYHKIMLSMLCPEEMKKLYDACILYNKILFERCRKYNVLIAISSYDFCMNTGPIISPECVRDVYMPAFKLVNQEAENAGIIPFFHCCGKVWDILDDYVDARFKGFQSIQQSAGMDSTRLKKEYGDKLALWTGVQCETLTSGSLEDIENEVTRYLETMMPGGGFIFGATNSVQFGAKTDNYLKALEVVREKGIY